MYMHIGHGRLCVYVSVFRLIPTLLHGREYKFGEWKGVPTLVVHYRADLQSVPGFRYYDNIRTYCNARV